MCPPTAERGFCRRLKCRHPAWIVAVRDEFLVIAGSNLVQAGVEIDEEHTMTKVYTGASMSLDGYISGPAGTGFEHLFKWYGNGDVAVPTTHPDMTMRMFAVSAEHFRNIIDTTGALVVGRGPFDSMGAPGGGSHPMGRPVVVVSHSVPEGWPRADAPFTSSPTASTARSRRPPRWRATRSSA